MEKLFDHKIRTDNKPANHNDNTFDFYDRSNSKEVETVRDTLNSWFEKYPKSDKKDLKSRFKDNFSSAFYELFIHELFHKQGFELTPHPEIKGTEKRPDFLVKGKGLEFYLEAKESTDKSEKDVALENRLNRLYDEINTTKSPNFFFRINQIQLKTENQPSGKKVVRFLENRLDDYDPEKIEDHLRTNGLEGLEPITYEDKNLKLVISLIPKSPQKRGDTNSRPIGLYPIDSFTGGSDESIKSGIEKKATRYGQLDKPFLVCINSTSSKGTDHYDIMNALFGSLMITYSTDPNNPNDRWERGFDGAFRNTQGPKYTRMSAVFITNVHSANLHVANHWLVKHPFAQNNLDLDAFSLSKIEVVDNKIETKEGDSIREILDIEPNWLGL